MPAPLGEKALMHERGCYATDENPIGLAVGDIEREVDRLGDRRILEREERGDIDRSHAVANTDRSSPLMNRTSDLSVELPFMCFVGLTEHEEMEVFNVINSAGM